MDKLYSADSHICEPADVWTSRMAKKWLDRAPRYAMEDGNIVGYIDGGVKSMIEGRTFGADVFPLDQNPADRLKILEEDGIWGEGVLGNLAGVVVMSVEEPEFALACAQAYNDWLAEAFDPFDGRIVGHAYIPMCIEPALAVAEIERCAAMGLKSIIIPLWPSEPYYLRKFDPVWEAAAAHKMPVCMHAHTGRWFRNLLWQDLAQPEIEGASMLDDPRDRDAVITAGGGFSLPQQGLQCTKVSGWFIGSGALERHPDLNLVFLECGAAWMLAANLWLDEVWYRLPGADRVSGTPQALLSSGDWKLPMMPSAYLQRQIHTTFQFEKFAVDLRHQVGMKNLMWGADVPHTEGTWPHTRQITD
ncbi:MAG: amidohydrolase 2, partial [Ilumatobacteraceae bacterium]|nr:amidohydrolase 2 [Ilumatobacteraceae bacterium]